MATNSARSYNCKDEELPVICRYAVFSLKRDLAAFTAFSPKFNDEYVTGFETKITTVEELVSSQSETIELKNCTDQLYTTMDGLISSLDHLKGYLQLAGSTIPVSTKDFGLSTIRTAISSRDTEKVLNDLHFIIVNCGKYQTQLTETGLSDTFIANLQTAYSTVSSNKQKQYEILSTRKARVQSNVSTLNDLYVQLNEILRIGKILFKDDPVKRKEYTFSELKKRVRHTEKNSTSDETTEEDATATEK